jgi:signal transduction histidine kinase
MLDELITKRANGDFAPTKQEDIWTSYYFVSISTKYGNYYTVQLFHPVEIALSSNKAVYIILAATFILIEAVIAFVMSKLYKNRKEYDMKSRRLSRGVAHELKTPLAVTKAYMDNWDYLTEEERASYAKKVNREVEDMTSLINALLEMDKIDSGSLKPEIEEVDLASLIRSVYNRIRPLAEERSLDVKLPEEEEVIIKTDLKLMKIALGNYITNMVKYADKRAEIRFSMTGSKVSVIFKNDSANDKKSNTDKINNNGMGVEINENIMKILGIACGSYMKGKETIFWFETEKV